MALAASTQKSYHSAFNQFGTFCVKVGASPFVVDEALLCFYVAYVAYRFKLKVPMGKALTIKRYLYGIRATHLQHGLTDPLKDCQLLHYMMRGVKKYLAAPGAPKKLPITTALLVRVMRDGGFRNTFEDHIFLAMCVLAVFGLLRCGEFTRKDKSDLDFPKVKHLTQHKSEPDFLSLRLEASKTDPFRFGCSITFAPTTSSGLNPVVRAKALLKLLSASNRARPDDPLFPMANGEAFLRTNFLAKLKAHLIFAKIPELSRYTGNSFRKGGAQSLGDAGVPDHEIRAMGRWSSWCFQLYISMSSSRLRDLSAAMAIAPGSNPVV
jgi:hypothetical protein